MGFGRAVNEAGQDTHGAGAIRFDTQVEGGPSGEGAERVFNFVRCVRGGKATPKAEGPAIRESRTTPGEGQEEERQGPPRGGPGGPGGPPSGGR